MFAVRVVRWRGRDGGRAWLFLVLAWLASTSVWAAEPPALLFSGFDKAVDALTGPVDAQQRQLDALEKRASSPQERALVLLQRCFLERGGAGLERSVEALRKAARTEAHKDLLAALALCEGLRADVSDAGASYVASARAWQHLSPESGALLRYHVANEHAVSAVNFWRPDVAIEAGSLALEIARKNKDRARISWSLRSLALAQSDLEMFDDALGHIDEAIRLASNDPLAGELLLNRAYILLSASRLGDALRQYQDILKQPAQPGRRYREIAESSLVEIYARLAQPRQALALADRLLTSFSEDLAEPSAYLRVFRGIALLDLGEVKAGTRSFQQGQDWFEKHKLDMPRASNLGLWAEALARNKLFDAAYAAQRQKDQVQALARRQIHEHEVASYKAELDLERKDREILALNSANRLQRLELENHALEAQRWSLLGAVICVLLLLAVWAVLRLRRRARQLHWQSSHDPLTGAYNRRGVEHYLGELQQGKVPSPGLSLLVMADIDHFKRINDQYGHAAGDAVLKEVAARLSTCVRREDRLVRWGGEEFMLCVHLSDADQAQGLMRRLLEALQRAPIPWGGGAIPVTASFGYAALGQGASSWQQTLEVADQALYAAKSAGRNRAAGRLSEAQGEDWTWTVPAQ